MKGILSLRLLLGFTLLLLAPLVMLFLPGVTWSAAINVSVNVQPSQLITQQDNLFLPFVRKPFLQTLTSDFTPCVGAPSGSANTGQVGRALLAYSTNGLDFSRPTHPADRILIDRVGVPDAVLLPSGRILVYMVDGCRDSGGTQPPAGSAIVAVSDSQGTPGSWVFKNVRFVNIPTYELGPNPVDPNVVLLPDGTLRMFASLFRVGVSGAIETHSFYSTDGGFTFSYEGLRYTGIADPEVYRFSDSNWQIITGGPTGYAMSIDGGNTFNSLGMFPADPGVIHEIALTDTSEKYRAYWSSPSGIKSFYSAGSPWTTWTQEPGVRLQVDTTTGCESCELSFPTVVKLGPGNYLMIYLTIIPGCECGKDPTTCP